MLLTAERWHLTLWWREEVEEWVVLHCLHNSAFGSASFVLLNFLYYFDGHILSLLPVNCASDTTVTTQLTISDYAVYEVTCHQFIRCASQAMPLSAINAYVVDNCINFQSMTVQVCCCCGILLNLWRGVGYLNAVQENLYTHCLITTI